MSDASTVRAVYRLESHLPLEQAAAALADEESSGTFVRVPGETEQLRARFAARVASVETTGTTTEPPLPGALRPAGLPEGAPLNVGHAQIDFPLQNFGPSLPSLLAAVAGNLFQMRQLAGVRLVDLELPAPFAERYPGPRFGVAGTRRLMGAAGGALVGSIVKPSVGLRPDELRPIVREFVAAGVDFIKDDELIADPPYSPLRERVRVVTEEIEAGAQRSGKRTMYAFNITAELDELLDHHDLVAQAGGTCVMVCLSTVGWGAVAALARHAALPIHGHRAMSGALLRNPRFGLDFRVYQKLARLVGADHLHTGGFQNKFYEGPDEVVAAIAAVREPLFGGYEMLPVVSSGQWAGTAPETFARTGTDDLLVVAGGGIHAHPDGVRAGVASLRQGWAAARAGIPLDAHAAQHPELRRAVEFFAGAGA